MQPWAFSVSFNGGILLANPQYRKLCLAYAVVSVQEPGESNAAIAAVLRGNRLANSIRAITLQMEKRIRVYEDGRTRLMEVHPFISCSRPRDVEISAITERRFGR